MKKDILSQAKKLENAIEKKKEQIVFLKRIHGFGLFSHLEQNYDGNPLITIYAKNQNYAICPRRQGQEEEIEDLSLAEAMNQTKGDIERELVAVIHNQINKAERELQALEAEFEAL